jgi:hypothetical protein
MRWAPVPLPEMTGHAMSSACRPYSELQVGSYVFMDADYGRFRSKSSVKGLP